ncbi:hypothetical protein [Saccharopolyspora sp. CA-218241]|uniref:hypothetical protein n=1 Tax=Saccharopolyspora sp. CA-218241 TaxID=3240027 RepID=UPI003D98E2B2
MTPESRSPDDVPTPPTGLPVVDEDGRSLADLIRAEDIGSAAPAVFGEPAAGGADAPAGDWPELEYRSKEQPARRGPLDWIRRRDR